MTTLVMYDYKFEGGVFFFSTLSELPCHFALSHCILPLV